MVRKEGIGPGQYGTRSLLGERFADVEEKYDLTKGAEGFGMEGDDVTAADENEDAGNEEAVENDNEDL